jgi:hypothetical protein
MKNAVDWQIEDSDDSDNEVQRSSRNRIKECKRQKQINLLKKRADLIYLKLQKDKYKVHGFKSMQHTPLKMGLPQSRSSNILGDLMEELKTEEENGLVFIKQSLNNSYTEESQPNCRA